MKRFLIVLSLICTSLLANANIVTKNFVLNSKYKYNVMIYTPDNTTGNLPTLFFVPGSGESTTNVNDLYINGPFHYIQLGWKPNFIVIGIQPPNGGPGNWQFVRNALDSLFKPQYRIDQNRWYMTGLSYGAATIYTYIQAAPDASFIKPAAIIPMSYVIGGQCGDFYAGTDILCGTDLRFQNIPAWGFCGNQDSFFQKMQRYFQLLTQARYNAQFTVLPGEGHCCWNTRYDPNYKLNGLSIYDWMLQYNNLVAPLPITLVNFQAIANDIELVLTWETDMESNSSEFIVERSTDGTNFADIAIVPTHATDGNSSIPLLYSYTFNF